jgi:hypothetical protein
MAKPRAHRLASDFTLHQWSEAGDVLATFEAYHRQTVGQMVQDVTADPPTSHGPPHHVIYLSAAMPLHFFKELFGRQHITLIIDPETPKEAIMKHWPEFQAWRRRLEAWQGPLCPRRAAVSHQRQRVASSMAQGSARRAVAVRVSTVGQQGDRGGARGRA